MESALPPLTPSLRGAALGRGEAVAAGTSAGRVVTSKGLKHFGLRKLFRLLV